jgi:hypothetical protein
MLRLVAMTTLAFVLLCAVAVARTVDVPARLGAVIPEAHDSGLVVLLPSRMNLDYESGGKIYAEGDGDKRLGTYALQLSGAKGCGGANACFLADFLGAKGAKLGYKTTNVKLALGMKGYYKAGSCGASCSPPSIAWIQKGVRYEIQAKALGGKQAFVAMANSAINAGNRK